MHTKLNYILSERARTTDTQRELFFENPKLGLGRQIGPNIFWAFGVFSADLSAPILVLCFPLIYQPLFLQKTKPLHPNPKYLF